ncbi:hypothetical protein BDZ89DRAFT_1137662 [Hymenopellis radicata]|nr:hypothetical protein BDZ89DRAFT_1137662 [Hymenopellis radicata]
MVSLGALVHTFMNKDQSSPSPKKRHGAIFPANFNVFSDAPCDETEARSTWEFHAPCPPASRQTSDASVASPAQEIVSRYRKKLTIIVPHRELSSSCTSSNSSAASEGTTLVGLDNSGIELELIARPTLFEAKGSTLRYDPACERILADARKETISEMNKYGASQRESLVCPRTGCRDTLRNARGLKMHLALHDIANEVDGLAFECQGCEACFETKQALHMHHCHDPPMDLAPPPESPTVAIFKRLLSPFTANFL